MDRLPLFLRLRANGGWGSWLGLAVVVGLLGGSIIAMFAGARRTETAYARFIDETRAFDVVVTNGTHPGNYNRQFDFDEIAALPQVRDAARVQYYFPSGAADSGEPITPSVIAPFASRDGEFGTSLNEMRIIDGRFPVGEREVAITPIVADLLDVRVGSTMRLQLTGPSSISRNDQAPDAERFVVVGEVAMQTGFPPVTGGLPPPVILSRAYARAHRDAGEVIAVRLRDGQEGVSAFDRALARLAPGDQIVTGARSEFGAVERGLTVQATALRFFAGLAGVVAILLVGQLFIRWTAAQSRDAPVLHALGATRAQLRSAGILWGALIAVPAAVVAVVTAVALSPLAPVGIARKAEVDPGFDLDHTHLGLGALGIVLLVCILSLVSSVAPSVGHPSWRLDRRAGSRGQQLFGSTVRGSSSVVATSGVRMAVEHGRGRSGAPVRSTMVSAVFAVALAVAALVFSTSLGGLFADPSRYGWNWDLQIGDPFAPAEPGVAERLSADPAVEAVSVATSRRVGAGDVVFDALATEPRRGALPLTVVEGREPDDPGEVLLGTRTLRELDARLGDRLRIRLGESSAVFTVVGRGVLPEFAGSARLGSGAALTFDGMRRLDPDVTADLVLARVVPGPVGDALVAGYTGARAGNGYRPSKPSDLADLQRVGALPSVLVGVLATMAVAALANALVTSVKRRRRELALLKVLGFVRGQVFAAVVWQASTVALIAAVAGIPLGVVLGGSAWRRFAEELGVPSQPVRSVLALGLVLPAVLLLAGLTAVLPARWAARTRPTVALRAE